MSLYTSSHYCQEARNLNHWKNTQPVCALLCPPIKLILYCKCITHKLKPFVSKCHPQMNSTRIPWGSDKRHRSLDATKDLLAWERDQESAFLTSFPSPKPQNSVLALETQLLAKSLAILLIQLETLRLLYRIQSCLRCLWTMWFHQMSDLTWTK